MKHVSEDEILEYLKGETGPETTAAIRRHLEACDTCRSALAALEATAAWLERWPDEEVPDGVLERTRSTVAALARDAHPVTPSGERIRPSARPVGERFRSAPRPWPARLVTAMAAVAAVLLVQIFLWNPFGGSVNIQGLLALTPPAMAMTAGQAVPDTVLIITLHPDGTVSTPLVAGRVSLDELTTALTQRVAPGTYRAILLLGTDPANPVSIRLSRFDDLKEALGITALHVGGGVVGVAPFFWSLSPSARNLGRAANLFSSWAQSDSLNLPVFTPGIAFPGGEAGRPWPGLSWQEAMGDSGTGHWIYTPGAGGNRAWNITPGGQWTVISQFFAPNTTPGTSETDARIYEALIEGNGVTAAITEEGRIVLSRSVVDPHLITQQLQLLRAFIPDLRLKILVPEDRGVQAQELEFTARQLGIESVEIVRVRKK